ncbi:UNVERIFIED_ORG: hypothetical protein ABID57_000697 [Arthrobacter sp. UYEF1]
MSQQIIYRVQNDTGPDELFTITRSGAVINLTGYTVKFGIKSLLTNTVTNTAHQTCTITDAANGVCTYRFVAGDLPDPGGDYLCDLQLTDAATLNETFYDTIRIKTRAEIIV